MNMNKLLITVCAGVLVGACSSVEKEPNPIANIDPEKCYFPKIQPREEAPNWVCTGHVPDVVTGVGIYSNPNADYNLAFQIGQQRARADLAQKLDIAINRIKEDYQSMIETGAVSIKDDFNRITTRTEIDRSLSGSRTIHSIMDPEGKLYVLVGLDVELAKSNLKQALQGSFNNPEAAHVTQMAEQALERLVTKQ